MSNTPEIQVKDLIELFIKELETQKREIYSEIVLEINHFNNKLSIISGILTDAFTKELKDLKVQTNSINEALEEVRNEVKDTDLKIETYTSYQEHAVYNLK